MYTTLEKNWQLKSTHRVQTSITAVRFPKKAHLSKKDPDMDLDTDPE